MIFSQFKEQFHTSLRKILTSQGVREAALPQLLKVGDQAHELHEVFETKGALVLLTSLMGSNDGADDANNNGDG